MKKTLKVVLIILMLVTLTLTMTGCGKEEKNEEKQDNSGKSNMGISRGTWNGNEYSNDFANIKLTLPEDWVKSTDEEIATIMNVGVELLNENQQKLAEIAKQTTVYCVVANDVTTGANVTILIEKPLTQVTEEYYLQSVKTQLEAVETMNYQAGETYKETISGHEYTALNMKIVDYGMEQSYFVQEKDGYIIGIIVTSTQNGQQEQILKFFK